MVRILEMTIMADIVVCIDLNVSLYNDYTIYLKYYYYYALI